MNISRLAFAAIGAAVLCGCVATNLPPADRRVTVAADLGTRVYVTDVLCAKAATSDFYTFQANVVNTTSSDLKVEWKVVWLDADGVTIDSVVSTWNSRVLNPQEICALKGTAPRKDAADMLFYVRRAR